MEERPTSSISEILIEAMKVRGFGVEKVSKETGISERFIRLLLEEKFEKLPATPYLHGYIMKIADTLDLNGEKIWNNYFKNNQYLRRSGRSDRLPENRFASSLINKKVLIGVIIVVAVVAYFLIRAASGFDISQTLSISNLNEDAVTTNDSTYIIRGEVDSSYQLSINQESVFPEENGNFSFSTNLSPGFNTIIFRVKGPLGREDKITRQIFYQPLENTENKTTTTTDNL